MNIFLYSVFSFLIVFLSGCAATTGPASSKTALIPKQGIYHKVKSGETLWRIAKAYQADIDEIVKSNNIANVAHIEKGQLIFIPGAAKTIEVVVDKPDTKSDDFIWPVRGKIISYFGDRQKLQSGRGIAIETQEGDAVKATRAGRVVFADYLSGYAYTIILDHQDGLFSVYAQNAKLLVKLGDQVNQGDSIAQVGRSGNLAFLHFEIRKNAAANNPLYYLP